jgi:hypothetical protein
LLRERVVAVRFGISIRFVRMTAVATVCTAGIGIADVAQAQDLLDALRSIFGSSRAHTQTIESPRPLESVSEEGSVERSSEGGSTVSYCVRLCDGRYFPLPRNAGLQSMPVDKVCRAMCPAAETKIFSGTSINLAVSSDGKNYPSIKNAFLYRERMVDGCSCNAGGGSGTVATDVEQDPTLRRGDIVVTRDGPKIFTGDNRLPHKPSEFVPADSYKGLPKRVREELSEMRVAQEPGTDAQAPRRVTLPTVPPTLPSLPGPHASVNYTAAAATPVVEAPETLPR